MGEGFSLWAGLEMFTTQCQHLPKVSLKSVNPVLVIFFTDRQTDRHHITSSVEVING